jgi:L-arabonate dehydrase
MKAFRSRRWLDRSDFWGAEYRAYLRAEGFGPRMFENRPIIGIAQSWSEFNSCHLHLRRVAEAVKRGVLAAGGWPLEFPTISISEALHRPSPMLLRNLMAMDVEESIRGLPMDGVVLLAGCDKNTPAYLLGAASAGLPSILVSAGPMQEGRWQGRSVAVGTDFYRVEADHRAGLLDDAQFSAIESRIAPSCGTCAVMGTASTMALLAESLGISLLGDAAAPANDAQRMVQGEEAGWAIVNLVRKDIGIRQLLSQDALINAVRMLLAIGGSTNAVIHLLALAGRLGLSLTLEDVDRLSRETPVLVALKPNGEHGMADLYDAGGGPAILKELSPLLQLNVLTASGSTLATHLERVPPSWNRDVIHTLAAPLQAEGGIAVLRGNLAPAGAVIKQSAASAHLLQHRGRAVVFAGYDDLLARIDDETLQVDENSVLVLTGGGPVGGPGMPEWGQLPLPARLLRAGVRDLVRISDARMSGTQYGTVVLHVAPEAAVGGPLALVRDGDEIALDVPSRRLDLLVSEHELVRRRDTWRPPKPHYARGYGALYLDHIQQADLGCDFDFLSGSAPTADPC